MTVRNVTTIKIRVLLENITLLLSQMLVTFNTILIP